jgi:hypothetical protein
MNRSFPFFTLVLLFTTFFVRVSMAQTRTRILEIPRQCIDIFIKHDLKPFSQMRSMLQPWELKRAGTVIVDPKSPSLPRVLSEMKLRDGTYPLLVDKGGTIIITHRLPNNQPGVNVAYLGTHRGLYLSLEEALGRKPQVVFAGQVRVVAGEPISLSDQASTFHDMAVEMQQDSRRVSLQNQLIQSNQRRLDFASDLLIKLGIIDTSTKIINFQQVANPVGIVDGHVTAQHSALFEMRCRGNPECWGRVERLDGYLKIVVARGGEAYILANMDIWIKEHGYSVYDFTQYITRLLQEGVIDTLTAEGTLDPVTELGASFQVADGLFEVLLGPL